MRYISNDDWGLDIVLELEPEAQVLIVSGLRLLIRFQHALAE